MTRIAYFGSNSGDAAVRRRAVALETAGFEVVGFMPRRGAPVDTPFRNIDLGETRDNAYLHRIKSIFTGAEEAARHTDLLRGSDLMIARNLDMLALAQRVRGLLGLKTTLIYECLDVHHKLSGTGPASRLLRGLERRLLAKTDLLVISSPAFEREHFAKFYPGAYRSFLVENRLIEGDDFPPRPSADHRVAAEAPLRIGWFGNLRCARSLCILTGLAKSFPERVEILLRGYPAPGVFSNFEELIAPYPNIRVFGRYRAPQDLAQIYGEVDLIWAGDWYEEGANSLWLLPNRIYEGGYFATPAIAPSGTETAKWLNDREVGFALADPIPEALGALVEDLLRDPSPILERRERLLALSRDTFVEGPGTMTEMVDAALGNARSG
ncbi:hypothetical protein KHP62_16180 [Rhodobacteraceae bacterium NNCM2]|nr:hypothetical protein [Coraliihabitans acroporae]